MFVRCTLNGDEGMCVVCNFSVRVCVDDSVYHKMICRTCPSSVHDSKDFLFKLEMKSFSQNILNRKVPRIRTSLMKQSLLQLHMHPAKCKEERSHETKTYRILECIGRGCSAATVMLNSIRYLTIHFTEEMHLQRQELQLQPPGWGSNTTQHKTSKDLILIVLPTLQKNPDHR